MVKYRIIFFIIFGLILSNCINSERKASRRVAKLIDRFPSIIDTLRIDTVKTTTIKYDTLTSLDTAYIDRLIFEACDSNKKEQAVKYLYKKCSDKVVTKTVTDQRTIIKTVHHPYPQPKEKAYPWWQWFCAGILVGILLILILKRN